VDRVCAVDLDIDVDVDIDVDADLDVDVILEEDADVLSAIVNSSYLVILILVSCFSPKKKENEEIVSKARNYKANFDVVTKKRRLW